MLPKLKSPSTRMLALAMTFANALVGCRSARAPTDSGQPHAVNVEVHNNLALPTDITIFVAGQDEGRRILGDVPPGQTKTLQFTPSSYSEPYRFLATRALRRDVVSQPFTVGSGMTGLLVWTLVPNIVGFQDIEMPDTTR